MKSLPVALVALGFTILCGCAAVVAYDTPAGLVKLDCVVERYDGEALVFYGVDTLPYDAKSRICLLHVLGPAKYRGRNIVVDLHTRDGRSDDRWPYLKELGAHIEVSIRGSDIPSDSKHMIPVEAVHNAEQVTRDQRA